MAAVEITFTELDVLKATKRWFASQDHFTPDLYHQGASPTTNDYLDRVERTCAIGGVEHSIYLLAKKDGFEKLESFDSVRERLARQVPPKRSALAGRPSYLAVYANAMSRCNRLAREKFGKVEKFPGEPVETMEDLTFVEDWDDAKSLRAVRRVLTLAISQVEAEAS